jgi:Na+-transporting NADH:ubiquinone oxidoreductase subunit NqrD
MNVRRHPIRGFLAGLFLGLGIALMLITLGIIPLTVTWLSVLTFGFAVLGVVGAYAVPVRGRAT